MIKYLFILISCVTFGQKTVSSWKIDFDDAWNNREVTRYTSISNSGDQGDIYYGGVAVRSHTDMWRATGDTVYLGRALTLVENVIATAAPSNTLQQSPNGYNDTYLSWEDGANGVTNGVGTNDGGQFSLSEGHGTRHWAYLLYMMYKSPTLRTQLNWQARYDAVLAFMQTHIWEKWETRGKGNFYRSRTHMASHWAMIGICLNKITGVAKYREIFDDFNSDMDRNFGSRPNSMREMFRTYTGNAAAWVWNSDWTLPTSGSTDVSHSNAEVDLIMFAYYELSEYWTLSDVTKIYHTLADELYIADGNPHTINVDGGGGNTTNVLFQPGWQTYCRLNASLQTAFEGIDQSRINATNYEIYHNSAGALNKAIIDATVFYPETEGAPDTTAPVATLDAITFLIDTQFRARFLTDEPSRFSIEYGTATGVYTQETTRELNYLSSHNQYVGSNNGPALTPATLYYFRGKTEDQAGNIGTSIEYTQITAGSTSHFSPKKISIGGISVGLFFYQGQYKSF